MVVWVHQVIYYDNVCGVPQIGHFMVNEANETDQSFAPNEETPEMLDFLDNLHKDGHMVHIARYADFMGKIPRVLAN